MAHKSFKRNQIVIFTVGAHKGTIARVACCFRGWLTAICADSRGVEDSAAHAQLATPQDAANYRTLVESKKADPLTQIGQ